MRRSTEILIAGSATVSAVFSGITLVMERRRHHWKHPRAEDSGQEGPAPAWALEGLKQALIDHINLSFKIGRACKDAVTARANGDTAAANASFLNATQLHKDYMDLMIYLRLLGSPPIVARAEGLHRSLDHLLDLCFDEEVRRAGMRAFTKSGRLVEGLTLSSATDACMEGREALINEARVYFGLPANASIDRAI